MKRIVSPRIKFSLFAFLFLFSYFCWAKSEFSQDAREYRKKGYQAQQAGNIETAIVYYKKAIALDPSYATPHNDLGIVYEMKGYLDKALAEYKSAIRINPDFAEAHMNLALLYESMNKIEQAIPHWIKRVELGDPKDPWTKKAWEKLWKYAPDEAKEIEAKVLAQEVAKNLKQQKESNKIMAEKHYQKGIFYFKKKLFENAYNELKTALDLAPQDKKYQEMFKKAQLQYKIAQINIHYKNGIDYLNSKDYTKAKQEFEKILEFVPREE